MGFRESLSLSPDCSLRKEFPDGEVYVQMSGVEDYDGPAHVNLYAEGWETVPRVPRMHLTVPMGTSAEHHVEMALKAEHADQLSDGDCRCIALDSLGVVARTHAQLIQEGIERHAAEELAARQAANAAIAEQVGSAV
jgi:hypothetical protein